MTTKLPTSVIETRVFERTSKGARLSEEAFFELALHLAYNPTVGEIIRGTGGVRKLRWRAPGRGKRGGYRVIYYYHAEWMPLFLWAIYDKADREDLSAAERAQIRKLNEELVAEYEKQRGS